MREAEFLSIIADEKSDVANIFQMVVVHKYILVSKPDGRFWNFRIPSNCDA